MTRQVHDRKCILRMEMGPIQRSARLVSGLSFCACHLVSSFWRPFESAATVENMPRQFLWGSGVLYYTSAPKDIQGVVTNYYRAMICL